jgi:hypothetical protein
MKVIAFLSVCVLALWAFASCNQNPPDFVTQINNPNAPTRTATLIPAYIATAQFAEAGAQATQSAGRGQMVQMDVTATALAIQREAISLQLTQAAATAEYFQSQTAEAAKQTQAAQTSVAATEFTHATETRQAYFDNETKTADAAIKAVQATATESALIVIRAAAEAEAQRIRDEQATANFRAWAWRIFLAVVTLMVVALALISLFQFRRAILSRMLLVRYGPKGRGKPYIANLQTDGSMKWADMSKSAGPVIDIPAEGDSMVQGTLDDPQMQTQLALGVAIAEALLGLNITTAEHRLPWERGNSPSSPDQRKQHNNISAELLKRLAQQQALLNNLQSGQRYLPPEIIEAPFREADRSDDDVNTWLDDVQPRLLG